MEPDTPNNDHDHYDDDGDDDDDIPAALEEGIQALVNEFGEELFQKVVKKRRSTNGSHHHTAGATNDTDGDGDDDDDDDDSSCSSSSTSSSTSSEDNDNDKNSSRARRSRTRTRTRTRNTGFLPFSIHCDQPFESNGTTTLQYLSLLRAGNLKGHVSNFVVQSVGDEEMLASIIETFDHYNKLRLKRLSKKKKKKKKNGTQKSSQHNDNADDGVVDDDEDDDENHSGKWDRLIIMENDVHRILDHPSMELFRGVDICFMDVYEDYDAEHVHFNAPFYLPVFTFHESADHDHDQPSSLISDDLMASLKDLFLRLPMESLGLRYVSALPRHTEILKELLEKKRIPNLCLDQFLCLEHIVSTGHLVSAIRHQCLLQEGEEAEEVAEIRMNDDNPSCFLENLSLRIMPHMAAAIIRATMGLSHLKTLQVRETTRSAATTRALALILPHPACAIRTLSLTHEDVVSTEAPDPLEGAAFRFDNVIGALQQNRSVQDLSLVCDDGSYMDNDDLRGLFHLIQTPENQIRHLQLSTISEDGGDEDEQEAGVAVAAAVEMTSLNYRDLAQIVGYDPEQRQGGEDDAATMALAHRCQIRSFDFGHCIDCILIDNDLDQSYGNVQTLIWLLSKRLPYLYYIGIYGCDDEMLEQKFGSLERCTELIQEIRQVGVWLGRNFAGRALLHPSVAASVPLGLWPVVLEKASNDTLFDDDDDQEGAAQLDGLYYMVQGLFLDGPLALRYRTPPAIEMATSPGIGGDDQNEKNKGRKRQRV